MCVAGGFGVALPMDMVCALWALPIAMLLRLFRAGGAQRCLKQNALPGVARGAKF